ncbi:MAG TPA: hypothetical protein VFV02_01080 [Acidimicrobiales bacterium]|nr:hypothetical protein [Acidimicrobiales bacterium]
MSLPRRHRPSATVATLPVAVVAALALLAASCTSSSFSLSPPPIGDTTTSAAESPTTPGPTTADPATSAPPPTTAPPATSVIATTAPCHLHLEYGYGLPDPTCTPGALNAAVNQANIGQTICATGWTSTVRPPESYTESLKRAQMSEYGETQSIRDYEEDHLVPLELGGAPSDPHNLWPEPGASPNPKDDVESAAKHAVCDERMTLASAQRQIASDWVAFGRALGVITGPGAPSS